MAIYTARRGSDLERPGTWVRYKDGLCDNCMALCCYLVIEVTAQDLIRLGITDEDEVEYDMRGLIKRLKKEGTITRGNLSKGKFTLTQRKQGGCSFLDSNNRCTVYEDRPQVCRKHPTELSPRLGYCPWEPSD